MKNPQANDNLKTGIKYFCITLIVLASIFCEVLLVIPVLAPQKAINIYKSMGLNAAAVGVTEHQYKKSNKIEDLYNLVLVCNQVESSEKLIKYSNELLNRSDFNAFEKAFNEYALKHTDSDKLYLVASLKNYLYEIRIEYEYKKSPETAFLSSIACFGEEDINLFYFAKYIDCILNRTDITTAQKKQLLSQTAIATVNGKTIVQLVKERYNNFKSGQNLEDIDLLKLEQLWQTKYIEVILLESINSPILSSTQTELENISSVIEEKLSND